MANSLHFLLDTPPKFNITPEKWWLEDDPFLLGFGNFFGENELLNFGRVDHSSWQKRGTPGIWSNCPDHFLQSFLELKTRKWFL